MQKYVALGQSNSLMKGGYLQRLKALAGSEFLRAACLGASPSVIGPYFLTDEFLQRADFCIVDTCVVDFSVQRNQAADYYQITKWVEWIGHKARINGCQPIFILIPVQHLAFTDPPLLSIYLSIIKASGYLFLDVRDILSSTMQTQGLQIGDLYQDGSHIGAIVCQEIAERVAGFLNGIDRFGYHTVEFSYALTDFQILNIADVCITGGHEKIERENSLFKFSGLRITPDSPINLELGTIRRLHGLMVNSAKSKAKVAFDGDVRLVKSLNLVPYSRADLEERLIPVRNRIQDRNGRMSISIAAMDEPSGEFTMQESAQFDDCGQTTEISDLLVERGSKFITYRSSILRNGEGDLMHSGSI